MSSDPELLVCAKTYANSPCHSESACGALVLAEDRAGALAEVARSHHASLVRFIALRTGSAEDAKEIAQEAYARVLTMDRPGTVSFLVGYLWRIAANLAIDRSRQRLARSRLDDRLLHPASASVPSTEFVIELRERLALVERAIGELPSRRREAFLLRIVQGRRFAQIGKEMGITERMAKIHVARAMEYLQESLDSAEAPRKLA